MANRETKVVVAAPNFGSALQVALSEHLKKWLKPEEIARRSVTDDAGMQKERLKQALVQTNPTALIAISVRPDSDTIAAYTAANVPIVLIDEETAGVSSITTNNRLGGQIAGEYLIAKGRKKIAIVSGKTQVQGGYNAEQRIKGFQLALSAGKLSVLPECMIEVIHYSREDGISVMPKLLHIGVDAIFCAAGDNCAVGLLTVAREQGVRIPEDIAIVGFDDLLIAQLSTPMLTTIRQPLIEMAEAAYKMAVIHRDEILRKPQRIIFKPELVVRQSA
ncbi:MAG: substrate-binding domain-containing protein [Bacteroidota bacterium]